METNQLNIEVGFIEFDPQQKKYWLNSPASFRLYAKRCQIKALKQTDIHHFVSNDTLNKLDDDSYTFISFSSSLSNHPHLYKKTGDFAPLFRPSSVAFGGGESFLESTGEIVLLNAVHGCPDTHAQAGGAGRACRSKVSPLSITSGLLSGERN